MVRRPTAFRQAASCHSTSIWPSCHEGGSKVDITAKAKSLFMFFFSLSLCATLWRTNKTQLTKHQWTSGRLAVLFPTGIPIWPCSLSIYEGVERAIHALMSRETKFEGISAEKEFFGRSENIAEHCKNQRSTDQVHHEIRHPRIWDLFELCMLE